MVEEKNNKMFLKDYYATKLLRDKDSRDYLLRIISAALKEDIGDIEENFELLDIQLGLSKSTKNSEADLVGETKYGLINIEINYCDISREVDNKNMSYICELFLRQTKPGKNNHYRDIKRVYQININGYDYFNMNKFIYTSIIMEEELKIKRNEMIKIVDINLDFLSQIDYTTIKEFEHDSLERLLYIFVCSNREELDRIYVGDKIMEKIKSKLYDLDTENLDSYLYYDKDELMKRASYEIGEREGREKGIKEGIEQERTKTLENIKDLIDDGVDKQKLINKFQLTKDEIEFLDL